jgi:predicted ester cyclase
MQPRHVVDRYLASQALQQRVIGLRSAFPDLQVTTRALVVEGDLVAAHFTGRGTHKGLFQGVLATGRGWQADCIGVYRVQDGRIAEAWVQWDQLAIMEQLGAIVRAPTVSA